MTRPSCPDDTHSAHYIKASGVGQVLSPQEQLTCIFEPKALITRLRSRTARFVQIDLAHARRHSCFELVDHAGASPNHQFRAADVIATDVIDVIKDDIEGR